MGNIASQITVRLYVEHKFISPDRVIADLEENARECDKRAEEGPDQEAEALREEANKCRRWANSLRFWTA